MMMMMIWLDLMGPQMLGIDIEKLTEDRFIVDWNDINPILIL